MVVITSDIEHLPTDPTTIANSLESTKCLQQITKAAKTQVEAEHVQRHIAAIIDKEVNDSNSNDSNFANINQVVLNLAFRSYFQVLQCHGLEDKLYARIYTGQFGNNIVGECQMLYAILLTDQCKLINSEELKNILCITLEDAILKNNGALLAVLKVLNLLCKKFPMLDVHLPLELVYNCLQSNSQVGVRDETLVLFTHCCKNRDYALAYFKVIVEFWPWANRNKYFLLSCIFQLHNYKAFLGAIGHSALKFFAGIRLSLHYKNLLACSQYLIRSLSVSESDEMLELTAEVLTRGSMKEIQNLCSHWFGRIAQKDRLFEMLQRRPEIAIFLEDSQHPLDDVESFRLILIFSLFSRQIFSISKLHFFKFSTELITNCFQYDNNSQLLIYKFIVDNLSIFSIEDCLEFILAFVQCHKTIENAHFRNNILGKIPTVINYISKTFNKMKATADFTTLGTSISSFFRQIQEFVEADICSKLYQPKIFALKLLQILLKSLYSHKLEKNAKNCSIDHNQNLGEYLIEQGIFHSVQMAAKLLDLLNDPLGFDDALELIVDLLQLLNKQETVKNSLVLCRDNCQKTEIDECALGSHYAKVALQNSGENRAVVTAQITEFALSCLGEKELQDFESDPLLHCKTKYHLFGYLNAIAETVQVQDEKTAKTSFTALVVLTETVLELVLGMLNLKSKVGKSSVTVASFQEMDESLQLLVEKSKFFGCDHEESRKYLLMSFWLTLRACCDLATAIGCHVVPKCEASDENLCILEHCLKVNVAVLTRCRHKGAIEAAGVTIGKLTKSITSQVASNARAYELLHKCLHVLFDDCNQVSTTRRGAGFSIMFLHIVKNEENSSRPILKRAMKNIVERLQKLSSASRNGKCAQSSSNVCFDRIESLTLHYVCVLVKDTELRDAMSKYYGEIILAAMQQIDHSDWSICNAALQLFGALIPKIVGQKQATEFEEPLDYESTEITFSEMTNKLPLVCENILQYCIANANKRPRSIILLLGFFTKVNHVFKTELGKDVHVEFLNKFRQLMWHLLRHSSQKVRQLAALCFVRSHEFRCDLPQALVAISEIIFQIKDENFFEGLLMAMNMGVLKFQHDSKHTVDQTVVDNLMEMLRNNIANNFKVDTYKLYTLSKLLDLIKNLRFPSRQPVEMFKSLIGSHNCNSIGYDVCHKNLKKLANSDTAID